MTLNKIFSPMYKIENYETNLVDVLPHLITKSAKGTYSLNIKQHRRSSQ